MALPALPDHAIHASIPACACSGVAPAICSRADAGARYRTRNFAISTPFVIAVADRYASSSRPVSRSPLTLTPERDVIVSRNPGGTDESVRDYPPRWLGHS